MKYRKQKGMERDAVQSLKILVVALTIHIFSVHSKLLYYLNPEVKEPSSFSFVRLNEATLLAMVFAVAYSLATVSVISRTKQKYLIAIFAVLDSLGVLLYYFTEIPLHFGAIYFAVYTGILIISINYLDSPEYLSDQIKEMKQKGISQREIAKNLNLSESKVSRLLNRPSDNNGSITRMNES